MIDLEEYDRFSRCIKFLLELSKDYQFDKTSDDYCGMINTDPSDHLSSHDLKHLIDNRHKYNSIMSTLGRKIDSLVESELILIEI